MAIQLTSPQEMITYLNTTQKALNESDAFTPFEGETVDKFMKDQLGMTTPMPEAPKYLDTYKGMREDLGLDEMEKSMAWYKDAIRREELLLNQQKNYMREQPVRLGVIEGRTDKATRDRQEQMQWYGNELSRVSDMVQGAYNQINMIMQFTQMDYETAKDQYQTEFSNRMNVYKAVTDQYNADRAFASTQWSMMASYISKGQTTWDNMSPDQKAQVYKYETMMGMPIGFMSNLQMEAGANIISTTQRVDPSGNTYVDIVYKDTDGQIKTESKLTGKTKVASSGGGGGSGSKTASAADAQNNAIANFNKIFQTGYKIVDTGISSERQQILGKDGKVSPSTWKELRSEWVQQGFKGELFDEMYAQKYVNKDHWWEYGGQLEKYF